ncbi:sigma-70 family RNA polymerase sigma factor [Acanthopleuribacter pedis]|uniref:Sigma-70 family RNA polymerase sigma factor n=1 Tax=Acanthopleuribacter pedis TaxID=442870 RepID=A0A8J7U4W4_9BACT|nr:sigma-70 family RNA polymerase sigma factor [Acanthopleuribacter pedis]MBO1319873.1 sigma-70 family RNA polymerase sigma factor [Acanthopleuribacter pedis]
MSKSPGDLTQLFQRWIQHSDNEAFDHAVDLVYKDLKRAAHNHRARFPNSRFQTTELVSESIAKLMPVREKLQLSSRTHFVNLVALACRRFLQEEIRSKNLQKHGGKDLVLEPLGEDDVLQHTSIEESLIISQALEKIRDQDRQLFDIVYYRHFLGFTIDEVSKACDCSVAHVNRKWQFAQAWLYDLLTHGEDGEED